MTKALGVCRFLAALLSELCASRTRWLTSGEVLHRREMVWRTTRSVHAVSGQELKARLVL